MESTYNSALLYDSVLDRIYNGSERISGDEECLGSIKNLLDAASATVIITRNDTHRIIEAGGVGVSQTSIESPASAHTQQLWRLDPGTRLREPAIMLKADDFYAEKDLNEFFNQCLRPFKLAPYISVTTPISAHTNLCLRLARLEGQRDFTGTDLDLAQAIAKHMRVALAHPYRGTVRSDAPQQLLIGATEAIKRARFGVIIIDDQNNILLCNDRGRRHLESVSIANVIARLKLEPNDRAQPRPGSERHLPDISASADPLSSFSVCTEDQHQTIRFLSQRLSHLVSSRTPAVTLTVLYTSSDTFTDVDPFLIRSAFGISMAESRVASLLVQGKSIDDVAHTLCKSRNTIRAHCRSIHEKMGVNNQAQLTAKILSSLIGLMDFQSAVTVPSQRNR